MRAPDPSGGPIIHVVDDDPPTATALSRLLGAAGFAVRTYPSATAFLNESEPLGSGCIILDVRLPDLNGLEVQQKLAERAEQLPIVFMTGHAVVPDSVRAIRGGAVDFLIKPVDPPQLLDAIARALAKDEADRRQRAHTRDIQARYERLTTREREVFAHLVTGQLNKQVAADLNISERTIKLHRARVFEKMEVDSIAGLTRLALELGIDWRRES
jgi:FixJ family two-component response regulator